MGSKFYSSKNLSDMTPPATLEDHLFYGIQLNDEQTEFRDAIWNQEKLIVFCNAKAGSGKTLVAVATANLLVQYGLYDGIVYVVSPTQEARSGFLPGDADEKTRVYTAPLYDALETLNINPYTAVNQESIVNQKNGTGYIDCVSHLWLRGCNISKKVVIVEESQNFYIDELKKVLTRVSDASKTIVIGHSGQCDLYHNPERSGFVPYINHFKDQPYAQICTLTTNYRGKVSAYADEL